MEYFYTYLWSITPVVELRGAIPIGYLHYKLSLVEATLVGIAGGITIAFLAAWLLPAFVANLKYVPWLKKIVQGILKRTRRDYSKKMKLWGEIFLVILVAIPLPGSGAVTGSIVAYLFGIRPPVAFALISTGVVISGVLVALITLTGNGLWELFFGAAQQVGGEVIDLVPEL